MLLQVTLVAGVGAAVGGVEPAPSAPIELTVTWPSGAAPGSCSGQSLAQALARRGAGCSFSVGGLPLSVLHAGQPPLVDGAVVVAWPGRVEPPPNVGTASRSGVEGVTAVLAVCSGPDAGALFSLRRGTFGVGRGQCHIVVADPALSRHHGTLVVGTRGIALTATGRSSGFTICRAGCSPTSKAISVAGTVAVEVGDTVGCGSSTFQLRFLDPAVPHGNGSATRSTVTADSQHPGSRTPAPNLATPPLLDAATLEPQILQHSPSSSRRRWAMIAAGCLPVLMGLALALATGSWMFLAFAAMGAVAVLVPAFGGGKRRRGFLAAVAQAVKLGAGRVSWAFPDAGALLLSAQAGGAPPPGGSRTSGLALRLGTATQAARLLLVPMDPAFSAPLLSRQPFCVRWGPAPLTVHGPPNAVASLLNFVLVQLDAAAVPVVLLGEAGQLPLAARFLPRTVLAGTTEAAQQALGHLGPGAADAEEGPAGVLVVVAGAAIRTPVLPPGLRVLFFVSDRCADTHVSATAPSRAAVPPTGPQPSSYPPSPETAGAATGPGTGSRGGAGSAVVELKAVGNRVIGSFADAEFVPDGVAPRTFDAYARSRAGTAAGPGPGPLAALAASPAPRQLSPHELQSSWGACAGGPLRAVALGQSNAGPTMFDFRRDGPHLLVAGTTGSGKSEFLRALVGSLAAAHSPADLQFIFIDFKGGAGLGSLTNLPHTASLLTDLGGHGVDRMLASLRAELHHREAALAAAGASDSDQYRAGRTASGSHALAHLVVVIDEFRILVDQYPDAMAELMRIAAVGRSLGIHLVMATQRPQGALNADIRANVTSSICLRVQSTFDSADVIGTGAAASISVSTPGRGFISRAGAPAEEFQSATLRMPHQGHGELPLVEVFSERLRGGSAVDPASSPPSGDSEAITELFRNTWHDWQAADPARRSAPAVIAPELPAAISLDGTAYGNPGEIAGLPGAVLLGMTDVPHRQSLEHLLWHPEHHSHLACFGTTAETSSAVSLAAGQLLAANAGLASGASARGRLLYLLDGDGSLAAHADSPWVGSCLDTDQPRAAAHLVRRLLEVARTSTQTLVLCITDWGRWVSAFRSSPWPWAEDAMAELVRFNSGGLVVVVGGGRELLTSHFLTAIPNRMFLPCGSNAESIILWPRLPRFTAVPARAGICGPINAAAARSEPETMHVAQLGTAPFVHGQERPSHPRLRASHAARTLAVTELPGSLTLEELQTAVPRFREATAREGSQRQQLLLGLGGDGRDLLSMTPSPGALIPVLGGSKSGKTTFLRALGRLNHVQLFQPLPPDDPAGIILVDNAAGLTPLEQERVTSLLAAGATIVAALPHPSAALSRLPLEWGLRTVEQGIVLKPQRPSDAELLGVRLDTAGSEPPGRGVLVDGGQCLWFQFPFPQLPAPAADS
ncbi:FtsK/SpoIIIE domain-containing protein [Arthrobacter sp. HLT1-20]